MFTKKEERPGEVKAFLGGDVQFEGKMTFQGTVHVDGKFKGEIVTDDTLIVGEGAEVEATVQADVVVICGIVRGDVGAKSRLELHKPGALFGDIRTKSLIVTEGATFNGRCIMGEGEGVGPFEYPVKEGNGS